MARRCVANVLILVGVVCLVSGVASAAPCPAVQELSNSQLSIQQLAPGAPSPVDDIAPELRLRFIQDSLRAGAAPSRIWTWGWGVGLSVSSAAHFALVPFVDDRGQRAELLLGGAKSLLGLFPILVPPLSVMGDARRLDADVAAGSGRSDECALVSRGERMLVAAARREAFGKSWFQHLGVVVVNVGVGVWLGLGYQRWTTGLLGAAVGIAVGETIIYTQPQRSLDALARYRAGTLVAASPGPSRAWLLVPTIDTRAGLFAGAALITAY